MAKSKTPVKTTHKASAKKTERTDWAKWLPALALLAITAIVFIPVLSADFVNWDDEPYVLENPNLVRFDWASISKIFTEGISGNYNPLPIFMFAVERALVGFDPWLYHFNNWWLHLLCTFLAWRLMLRLGLSPMAAFFGALLFGIHPMRVESVAWITERKDVLYGAFFLGALLTYLKWMEKTARWGPEDKSQPLRHLGKWFWLTVVLMFFSGLSKIQVATLPFSMLAIDLWLRRPFHGRLFLEKWPLWILMAVFVGANIYTLRSVGSLAVADEVTGYSITDRLAVGGYSYWVYIIKWIFPYEMTALYPYLRPIPWQAYAAFAAVPVLLAGIVWAFLKKQWWLVFGFLFFSFNIGPLLQVLSAGQGFLADRFTYIAYIGLFFILAKGWDILCEKKPQFKTLTLAAWAAYFILFSWMTWNQCKTWESGFTMWEQSIKVQPSPTALQNLGRLYREDKTHQKHRRKPDDEKSLQYYDQALAMDPKNHDVLTLRGNVWFGRGDLDKALADYNAALASKPDYASALDSRGVVYGVRKQVELSLADLRAAIQADSTYDKPRLNLGLVLEAAGEHEEALAAFEGYLKLKPYDHGIYNAMGVNNQALGRLQKAMEWYDMAIAGNPKEPVYWVNRSTLFNLLNDRPKALENALKAKELGSNIPDEYIEQMRD